MKFKLLLFLGLAAAWMQPPITAATPVHGWLDQRGPYKSGFSDEKNLPDTLDANHPLWSVDFPGQSTSVVANGKVYIMGYSGEGPDLQEGVSCFDADTGKLLWRQLYNDFLSDTIYLRYATSSPAADPETGNVYIQGTQGILAAFSADGKTLWNHSLMETYGRLTFPNGRTASPAVDGDLVITRGITANWGANGPAGDRFYAFDKNTGDLVWSSSPGDRPKDNSYSHPYFTFIDGRRVFFSATGDGSVVCVNARTGDPIWRVPMAKAGINSTLVVHNNERIIAIYGTPYEPGQMVALKIPKVVPTNSVNAPIVIERSALELWSLDLSTSSSSPILAGDRVYVVAEKGDLNCVDVISGKILWKMKLGIEERNACPLYADGKLYVPMLDDPDVKSEGGEAGSKGAFYIIKPNDQEGKMLSHAALDGRCFGTPTAYNGKIYIQTTKKLYCFGNKGNNPGVPKWNHMVQWPKPGPAASLQIIPSEVLLKPNQSQNFRIRELDANGFTVRELNNSANVKWSHYIPPTAKVKASMNAEFDEKGVLVAASNPAPSAGAFEAVEGNLKGYIRGRVLPGLPIKQDFESIQLTETTTNTVENPTPFAYPPLPWIGARFKFEVRQKDETKCLTKTIDNKFFQRATVFMGDPSLNNYTIEADVMSEGNKRKMSDVGIINQRYLIVLKGNEQKLEINSNLERLRVPAANDPPNFKWSPNIWYHLKARVDMNPSGGGTVRAKAWKRGDPEPDGWTIEVEHKTAHKNGCPGLFGFSPQDMRVFIDNVQVTANK